MAKIVRPHILKRRNIPTANNTRIHCDRGIQLKYKTILVSFQ